MEELVRVEVAMFEMVGATLSDGLPPAVMEPTEVKLELLAISSSVRKR